METTAGLTLETTSTIFGGTYTTDDGLAGGISGVADVVCTIGMGVGFVFSVAVDGGINPPQLVIVNKNKGNNIDHSVLFKLFIFGLHAIL